MIHVLAVLQAAAAAASEELTFARVVEDIPHDPAAFLVYGLIAVSVGVIWKANRKPKAGR